MTGRATRIGMGIALAALASLLVSTAPKAPRDRIGSHVPAPPFAGPVPAPFEPVRAHPTSTGSAVEVEVWGRRYVIGAGGMPERIESQGVPLLREPARWTLETSGGAKPVWSAPEVESSTAASVRLVSTASLGPLLARSRTLVEFDGMIRVELTLEASEQVTLDRVGYEWVLPEAVARLFQHHLEYDYTRLKANQYELAASAGLVPPGLRRFVYAPAFSLANREVGLEWWSETNLGWSAAEGGPIQLRREAGLVHLRIEPIAQRVPLAKGATWSHTFAVFPMPMRPEPPRWRSVRFTSLGIARRLGSGAGARYLSIPFPGPFQARWHGLPAANQNPAQRKLRSKFQELGVGYIPYGKLMATPSLHPTPMERVSDWSATGRLFTWPGASQRRFLEERGWKPKTPFGYSACTARWDYFDWMLKQNLGTFDEESLDGLYFDIGGIFEPCLRALPPDASEGAQLWDYFTVREFYRRLFVEVKRRRPDALIAIHSNGSPKALHAFVDYGFVGEALNGLFRRGHSPQETRSNPGVYAPDYQDLPEGFLDALMLPRVGGITSLLPQVVRVPGQNEERVRRASRALLARILVDDLHVWLTRLDNREMVSVLRGLDRLGNLDEADRFPWWEEPIAVANPPLRITGYNLDGQVLLVIANGGDRPLRSTVELDEERLGWPGVGQIEDVERRKQAIESSGSRFQVSVPARDFRLILGRRGDR